MKRAVFFILGILAVVFAAIYGNMEALQIGAISLATVPMVGSASNQQVLKGLKEDMGKAHKAIRDLDDLAKRENRSLTAEEEQKRTQFATKFDEAKANRERILNDEARAAEMASIDNELEENRDKNQSRGEFSDKYAKAFRSWIIGGMNNLDTESREILRTGKAKEDRALTTQTGASGGYTIPEGFMNKIDIAVKYYCNFLGFSNVVTTATGNDLPWPTANDTGNIGALLAENTTIGSSVEPTFGSKTLKAHKFTSKPVVVPNELLVDTAIDLDTELGNMLGERIGRIMASYFTTGTGSSQPQGVVTGASDSSVSAAVAAISFDNLIDLFHSVDIAYRNNARWMFNDSTLKALRKLKDGNSQYLWQPGLTVDAPATILSKPYEVNNFMATIGASAKSVVFGDFNKFKIRVVQGMIMKRLVERYADLDQTAFIGFKRADSAVLDAGTNPIKYLAHAAE